MTYTLPRRPAAELTLSHEVPAPPNTMEHPGSFATVIHTNEVTEMLEGRYDREGLCLKVIPNNGAEHPSDSLWDGEPLGMTSLIQNFAAMEGLAPRVYDLVMVNGTHAAQVTDWVAKGRKGPRKEDLLGVFTLLGITSRRDQWDIGENRDNWRSGLFVDFSGLRLDDEAMDKILATLRLQATMKKGQPADGAYQAVPTLAIPGDRPGTRQFIPFDCHNLNVLDVGCNLGHFSRLAVDHGAVRVVGVDRGMTAMHARIVHALLGYWGIDVVTATLPAEHEQLPDVEFDLAVCLSTINYMGDDGIPWLSRIAPALWLEGHGSIPAESYLPALNRSYAEVTRLADTTDNKVRAQFYCTR